MKTKITCLLFVMFVSFVTTQAQDWNEIIKAVASDRAAGDSFGYAVAISGNYAIVGAVNEDEDVSGGNMMADAGSAYIFHYDGNDWVQDQKIVASDRAVGDHFGNSVAISGDYAIVGAIFENGNSGSVYIYYNNAGTWEEDQIITASDRASNDYFGMSVSISGDYAIVGASTEDEDENGLNYLRQSGSAYIFHHDGSWNQVQKIVASDRDSIDYFGISVAISGDYAIVGAYNEDNNVSGGDSLANAGSAYIFYNNGSSWVEDQKIVASDREEQDNFGYSVSISGDYAILGAYNEDEDATGANRLPGAGSAYIFYNNGSNWVQDQKIVASDREEQDYFGSSVSISGDYAIVGAYREDEDESGGNEMPEAGSAYVFYNNTGTWEEVQKAVASDRAEDDSLGFSVAISGDYIIIGAFGEDEDVSGSNPMTNAGSVYFFTASPIITGQPVNLSNVCVNSTETFSVSGDHIDDYQWQLSTDGGSDFNDISDGSVYSNTQTATLSVTVSSAMNSYQYRCAVSNSYSTVYSDAATLNLETENPVITSTHNDQTVNANTSCEASLPDYTGNVTATDNCDLSLDVTQSPVAGTTISGTTNQVTVTVTDDAGNDVDVSFNVEVVDITDPAITSTHNDQTVDADANCEATLPDYTGDVIATDNCDASLDITQSPVAGTTISGATNQVTLTVTDDAGNDVDVSFNVEVVDITDPAITSTHNDQTVDADASCEATLPDYTGDVTATDNCDASLDITQSPIASTTISGATNQVTLTVTDDAGNDVDVSFNVEVVDVTDPVITSTHNDQTVNGDANCEATLPDYKGDITATDNCDISLDVTQSPVTGTTITGATNLVTLTVTDDDGNSIDVSFNVEVVDITDPVITSTHSDQTVDANANCEAALPDYTGDITATDNCDISLDVTQSPLAGTTISGSANQVTLTVTDDAGNDVDVSFNVEVVDVTDPVITSTHNDQAINDVTNCSGVLPDYTGDVIATDNCDVSLEVTQLPIAGTSVSVSVTVTLTVTDDNGNFESVNFNVAVADNTDPVITSTHDDETIDAVANCQVGLPDYTANVTATDNCDTDLDVSQSPVVGTSISGSTNQVTLTVTDDTGNNVDVSFNVEVVDNSNPVITSTHNDQSIDADASCEAVLPDYTGDVTATDNCDATLDVTQSPVAGTSISGATNQVTLTVTDDAGNSVDISFNVEVIDNISPTITCLENQTVYYLTGQTFYTVSGTEFDPVSTNDNCGITGTTNDFNNLETLEGAELPIGTTTIIWTVTDDAGNFATCSFDVTVSETVGISNLSKSGISIYPNPTNGILKLEFKQIKVQKIRISDLSGRTKLEKTEIQPNETINLSHLRDGIYIIRIQTDKEIFITKIVKEN